MSEYFDHPLAQQDTFAREPKPKPLTYFRKNRSTRSKPIMLTLSRQYIDANFSDETLLHTNLHSEHDETKPDVDALDLEKFCCIDKTLERQRQNLIAQFHRDLQVKLDKLSLEFAQELDLLNLIARYREN